MKHILLLALAALLTLTGCAPAAPENSVVNLTQTVAAEPVELVENPDSSAISAFGTALLQQAAEGTVNPVISPLSAYLALAMVANGTDGETLAEFTKLLGMEPDVLNANCRAWINLLTTDLSGSTICNCADSVWIDPAAQIRPEYLSAIASGYDAEAFQTNLATDAARAAVNKWVSEKTSGLIPTLREENYPDNTMVVLLNTLYFKALWDNPFYAEATESRAFTKADGGSVDAPFLQDDECRRDAVYLEDAEGILLPYDDGTTAFLALRPTDGVSAREYAASLTAEKLAEAVAAAEETLLNFAMPKFAVENSLAMNEPLKAMGLINAFEPDRADFSKMGTSQQGALYLSSVQQKVKIIVDEKGTEAAAVTEAAAADAALNPEEPKELILDSPFVYAVVDLKTAMPLFLGIMDNPAA